MKLKSNIIIILKIKGSIKIKMKIMQIIKGQNLLTLNKLEIIKIILLNKK